MFHIFNYYDYSNNENNKGKSITLCNLVCCHIILYWHLCVYYSTSPYMKQNLHASENIYCKPRKNSVPLIITNLTSATYSFKLVVVNVLRYAHAHERASNVSSLLAGWF